MEDVAKVADRILVMHKGKCILDGRPSDVFKEIGTLESVGLAVPQVTYLMKELKEKGFNISGEAFTIEQAKKEILNVLRSAGK
jgi:energy-coupling factor transport system ATP-binding protein